jgi:hypothetical protein
LEGEYGTLVNALQHAMQGGLEIGGGATPCFVITFIDDASL